MHIPTAAEDADLLPRLQRHIAGLAMQGYDIPDVSSLDAGGFCPLLPEADSTGIKSRRRRRRCSASSFNPF